MNSLSTRLFILPFALLLCTMTSVKAQSPPDLTICKSSNLPLSIPAGVPDGTVSGAIFVSTRLKDSSGSLSFHNSFKQEILAFELVVQFLDNDGNQIMPMSFVAEAAKNKGKFQQVLQSQTKKDLKKGLDQNKVVYPVGESSTVVRTCPTKATVAFLHILFGDIVFLTP